MTLGTIAFRYHNAWIVEIVLAYYVHAYQFTEKSNFVSNHRLARSVRTAALASNGVCIAGRFAGERPLLILMVSV